MNKFKKKKKERKKKKKDNQYIVQIKKQNSIYNNKE